MINIKPDIKQALESNSALVSLLDGTHIYQIVAPSDAPLPRVTFFEMINFDSEFADDKPIASEIHIQIDVWSNGNTSAIAEEVDNSLKSIGMTRYYAIDLYEYDTRIYHKSMRYVITKEI